MLKYMDNHIYISSWGFNILYDAHIAMLHMPKNTQAELQQIILQLWIQKEKKTIWSLIIKN